MATAKDVIPYRRKREGRTNYKKRLALLKSGKPRLVVRVSNRHVQLQLISYEPDGDHVLLTVNSKTLAKQGWTHGTKSLPAAYCAGYLAGKLALERKAPEAIVDLGLQQHRAGTRIYAAVKGAVDAGLKVPVNESVFPTPERLRGEHLTSAKPDEVASLMKRLGFAPPAGTTPKKEKGKEQKGDKGKGDGQKAAAKPAPKQASKRAPEEQEA